MDKLLHDQYWRTLGWSDPVTSAAEKQEFVKCAFKRDDPVHADRQQGKTSFCVLNAGHERRVLVRGRPQV